MAFFPPSFALLWRPLGGCSKNRQISFLSFCSPIYIVVRWITYFTLSFREFGRSWGANSCTLFLAQFRWCWSLSLTSQSWTSTVCTAGRVLLILKKIFWSWWREEYLTLLQHRSKWCISKSALQVNDFGLVQNENLSLNGHKPWSWNWCLDLMELLVWQWYEHQLEPLEELSASSACCRSKIWLNALSSNGRKMFGHAAA